MMGLVPSILTVIGCLLSFFGSIICCTITGLISVLLANNNTKSEINNLKKQNELEHEEYLKRSAYEIRKATILDTLNFLDDYISWLNFDSGKTAERKELKTSLTFTAREYYDKLCITCNNSDIIKAFNAIVFSEGPISLERYNDFRNAARGELGLSEIELDHEHIFISKVATEDLNKAKQLHQ